MSDNLSSIPALCSELHTPKIISSIVFLRNNQAILQQFEDWDDLTLQVDINSPPSNLKGVIYHFRLISAAFAKLLWSKRVFIELSVILDLLFSVFRKPPSSNPIEHALMRITDNGIHEPGFVLYPIHSLGLNAVGFLEFFSQAHACISIPSPGILFRAQTNSLEASLDFLKSATATFSIDKAVSLHSVKHYYRSRAIHWLTRNPLLAVRVSAFSGNYYENQQFLLVTLKIATSLLFMMAALQSGYRPDKADMWGSTRRINNSQTLDLHHYFLFERPASGDELSTRCVPMNVRPDELADLSALPIDLAPKLWARRTKVVNELAAHLSMIEGKYMSLVVLEREKKGMAKAVRKIFSALAFFRRSFKSRGDSSEQVANLAIAFEVLLTGGYAPGVGKRFKRRIRLALKGIKGSRRMQGATAKLYSARSDTVHEGALSVDYDLTAGQEAFVYVFLGVARRFVNIPPEADDPIGAILGE